MRIVVFTALIGPAESAPLPGPDERDVRYVCFTDRPAPGWEIRVASADFAPRDPRRVARYIKTHPADLLPEHNVSIWIDASFDLVAKPSAIVAEAFGQFAQIVALRHPDRDSIDAEGAEIKRLVLAPPEDVDRQLASYRAQGFHKTRLTTTGLVVRSNSRDVARFNARWWAEIETFTLRDQLSVDYAAWKCGLPIGYLPGNYRANEYARYRRDRHRERRVA